MAEFQEVMKQWRRICKAHESCGSCLLYGHCVDPDLRTDTEIARLDEVITNWAEEHPEPVYPTWLEFVWCELAHNEPQSSNDLVAWMDNTHIPADIAQKLGIKPKEDTCG